MYTRFFGRVYVSIDVYTSLFTLMLRLTAHWQTLDVVMYTNDGTFVGLF